MEEHQERLITKKEAADEEEVSLSTLGRMITRGELDIRKKGGKEYVVRYGRPTPTLVESLMEQLDDAMGMLSEASDRVRDLKLWKSNALTRIAELEAESEVLSRDQEKMEDLERQNAELSSSLTEATTLTSELKTEVDSTKDLLESTKAEFGEDLSKEESLAAEANTELARLRKRVGAVKWQGVVIGVVLSAIAMIGSVLLFG